MSQRQLIFFSKGYFHTSNAPYSRVLMVEDTCSWFSILFSLSFHRPLPVTVMAVHTKFQMRRRAHRLLLLINVHHSKFYFAPVPRRMRYAATIQRFLKVMAMVWAGSQVTKLARAAGALALAPLVDKGPCVVHSEIQWEVGMLRVDDAYAADHQRQINLDNSRQKKKVGSSYLSYIVSYLYVYVGMAWHGMGVILINQTNCVLFVSVSEDDDEDLFTVPDVQSRPPLSNTNSNSNSSGKRRTVRNLVDRDYGKLKSSSNEHSIVEILCNFVSIAFICSSSALMRTSSLPSILGPIDLL
ncbi:hypothetical protein Syun_008232 [Stephania yunnanensis]|uniref:Uncharacterized protein n=1 Tax=Stephania yunnanensis TaxID=152371 RepID=A0AAP0Q375_9MAGN